MFKLRTNSGKPLHPAVAPLGERLMKGEIDRREFLRTVGLLGVSAASASAFATGVLGAPGEAKADDAGTPGGTLRFTCQVQDMSDPALVTWIEASNVYRNVIEFLTRVDENNITHPYLAAQWDPTPDLKTWVFALQPNVKWSNGDDFTTEDVLFNFKRWMAADSKSPNKSSFSAISDIKATSPLEFVIKLSKPIVSFPEMLYAYNCAIVHRKFDEQGSNFVKNPIGTGPYALADYEVSRKAVLKKRDGYWGKAPYLDEIQFIDMGTDISSHVAALASDQVDLLYRITTAEKDLVDKIPTIDLLTVNCAQTVVMRMQMDQKPFDDIRVRKAMQMVGNNQQMLDIAYRGLGTVGENHHVAPSQPEYFKLPPVARDVEGAKKLLAEAGYPNGLTVKLTLGNTQGHYEQDTAQVLQQNAAEAGIKIDLEVLPTAEYWPIWNKVPFGLTYWAHRPLAVMTLDLAYRSGAAWNESNFKSPEFDAALDVALGLIDPVERSKAMQKVEQILQDQAVMVQPFWPAKFTAASKKVKGFKPHPADYFNLFTVSIA